MAMLRGWGEEEHPTEVGRGADRLRRRIEEMRAMTGHALRCSECDRLSSGRATGWTMHLEEGRTWAFCPECEELDSG